MAFCIDDLFWAELESPEAWSIRARYDRPLEILAVDYVEGGVRDAAPQSERP